MSSIDWAALHQESTVVLEGDFPVVLTKAEATTSSTGKPMIKFTVTLESGPYAGRQVNGNFTITADNPQSMRIFFSQMNRLGLGTAFFAQQPSTEGVAEALVGKRAIVTLEGREWAGEVRENVKAWKTATGAAPLGVQTVANASGGGLAAMAATASTANDGQSVPATQPPADPF
jgi:hypothetical protein